MRLKSFHAPTIAEAMAQVRKALGEDAIIVATREDDDGRGVRVTAAIDDSAEGGVRETAVHPKPGVVREPEPDVAETVQDALFRHGVPAALTERLMAAVEMLDTPDPVQTLAAALEAEYGFAPVAPMPWPKPMMLVGPPGAGKTLGVAKIAARAVLKGLPISVMTTDTVRAGGVDQLAAFMRVLKVGLIAVEDPVALCDGLAAQRNAGQILIDSMGRNPFSAKDMEDLADLVNAGDIEPVLVLPAGGDAVEAVEIAHAFHEIGARRVLTTRLDMTRRLGSLLAAASDRRLSFADASLTPKVAEGLVPLTPLALARLFLPEAIRSSQTAKQTGTYR